MIGNTNPGSYYLKVIDRSCRIFQYHLQRVYAQFPGDDVKIISFSHRIEIFEETGLEPLPGGDAKLRPRFQRFAQIKVRVQAHEGSSLQVLLIHDVSQALIINDEGFLTLTVLEHIRIQFFLAFGWTCARCHLLFLYSSTGEADLQAANAVI